MIELQVSTTSGLTGAPDHFRQALRDRLTFANPAFAEAERMGRWTGSIPQVLCYLDVHDGVLSFPRGFTRQAINMLRREGLPFRLNDRRRTLPAVDLTFHGTLRDFQQEALDSILAHDFGTVSLPTGAGKTVIALATIAERKQRALIVVHTRELLDQWIARIETFLGIPRSEIGVIGSGKRAMGDRITVGLVQTLAKCASDVAPHVGSLVVDECHRTPSRTFTDVAQAFDCRFMLGLSATPFRRDGLGRLIWWSLGDQVFKIERDRLIDSGDILPAVVITRETEFRTLLDPTTEYSKMLSGLTDDDERNSLIVADVVRESCTSDGVLLVISDRRRHCKTLQSMIADRGISSTVLHGDLATKQRRCVVEAVRAGQVRVLVATAQLIGEGFDCAGLSTLFLATPIKFDGRLLQVLGRVLRPAAGKSRARVFDYIDAHVGVLKHAAECRRRVYQLAA